MSWDKIVMFCLFILPFWAMFALDIWGDVGERFMEIWEDLRRHWRE